MANSNRNYYWGGTNLQMGSKGFDVEQLQTFLAGQGYYTGKIDGDFGDVTYGALKAYQKANGIGDDGIFGPTTAAKAGFMNYNTQVGAAAYTPIKYDSYTGTVIGKDENGNDITDKQAKDNAYNAVVGYDNPDWDKQGAYDALSDKYTNRGPFSYDFNADALYQQYKDRYIQQGKMAMQDAMGQAAAMTGGYGNSYAATVGNQAYQQSLQQLNDVIPELYKLAYDRYNQEGQDMLNALGVLESDRSMYMEDWQTGYDKVLDAYTIADDMYKDNESKYYTDLANENAYITDQNTQAWKEVEWEDKQSDQAYDRAKEKNEVVKGTVKGDDDEDDDDDAPLFSGSTYEDAYNYAVQNGVLPAHAAGIMTASEWSRRKASYKRYGQGSAAVKNYNSYAEYLAGITAYLVEQYK